MSTIQETLTGNPYAGHAEKHITWTHDWQGDMGDTPETQLANTGIAQAYATLTLAYEIRRQTEQQRADNQLAQYAREVINAQALPDNSTFEDEPEEYPSATDLADQIEAASKATTAAK